MNKKLLLLFGAYVGGVFATLMHNKKNPIEIQSEVENAKTSGKKSCSVYFDNFIEIHKNFFDSFMNKHVSEDNKAKFMKNKDKLLLAFEDFKEKAQNIFEEYKVKGKDYTEEGIEKLEKFYNEKLIEIEEFRNKFPEIVESTKQKLISSYDEFKSKIKK